MIKPEYDSKIQESIDVIKNAKDHSALFSSFSSYLAIVFGTSAYIIFENIQLVNPLTYINIFLPENLD